MQLKIIDRLSHDRGVIYKIKISDKNKEILYLSHAIEIDILLREDMAVT